MSPDSRVHLEVAAGVIWNEDSSQVLIAQRPHKVHQGGLWEFPGGKLESGESVEDALVRELHEEIGITVHASTPLITLHHDYPDRSVRLHVREVRDFEGEPHGVEGQPVCWVFPEDLQSYSFPAANDPIRRAVQLPDRYPILNLGDHHPDQFISILRGWAAQGIRFVRFRTIAEHGGEKEWLEEASRLGLTVMVDQHIGEMSQNEAYGLHLRSWELQKYRCRPVAADRWLAASCHHAEDLAHAAQIGVDFAVLGPVLATASHPGEKFLGWDEFHRLVAQVSFPVYALGGVGPEDIREAREHGAQGIAGIRAFL